MNGWILIGLLIFGWLILSQLIAWFITPSQDEDEVLESWFVVFMAPVALALAAVMIAEEKWRNLARRAGMWWL